MDSTKFSAALAARIDSILDAALTEQRIVGAVFLAAREGSLVCERALGQAERETQRPMRKRPRRRKRPARGCGAAYMATRGSESG